MQKELKQSIPERIHEENLLIASWNIKEFGHLQNRLPESMYYMAEIISSFDLVAIQEVKGDLKDFHTLMKLLGHHWDYVITDITEGAKGNSERFAYVYDSRRVQFAGLAGEIVLWNELTSHSPVKQLKRTPYITAFKANWKTFAIINVHLQPGDKDEDKAVRKEEVRLLTEALRKKLENNRLWTNNLMMMGDFNFYGDDEDIIDLMENLEFKEPEPLKGLNTNVSQTEIYDRVFFRPNNYFSLYDNGKARGGVFNFYSCIFKDDDYNLPAFRRYMKEHKTDPSNLINDEAFKSYYKRYWRNMQMSDHYPLWVEMSINSTERFLKKRLKGLTAETD